MASTASRQAAARLCVARIGLLMPLLMCVAWAGDAAKAGDVKGASSSSSSSSSSSGAAAVDKDGFPPLLQLTPKIGTGTIAAPEIERAETIVAPKVGVSKTAPEMKAPSLPKLPSFRELPRVEDLMRFTSTDVAAASGSAAAIGRSSGSSQASALRSRMSLGKANGSLAQLSAQTSGLRVESLAELEQLAEAGSSSLEATGDLLTSAGSLDADDSGGTMKKATLETGLLDGGSAALGSGLGAAAGVSAAAAAAANAAAVDSILNPSSSYTTADSPSSAFDAYGNKIHEGVTTLKLLTTKLNREVVAANTIKDIIANYKLKFVSVLKDIKEKTEKMKELKQLVQELEKAKLHQGIQDALKTAMTDLTSISVKAGGHIDSEYDEIQRKLAALSGRMATVATG